MRVQRQNRPNFTLLWAAGAFAAICWLLEPLVGGIVSTGSVLAGALIVPEPSDLSVRGGIALLFVLMGLYEQAMLGRLEKSERRYHELVERIPDVTWTAGRRGERVFVSPNAAHILGHAPDALLAGGADLWWDGVHPDDAAEVRAAFAALFETDTPFDVEYRMRRGDGRWIWLHDRAVATYRHGGHQLADGVITDVTDRKEAQEALHYVSYFDTLTGLPNRTLLRDRLGQALAQSRRHGAVVAVLMLKVLGLHEVHDTHGDRAAERVLKDVVARLTGAVREEDTVARWGGDDLAVVLPDTQDLATAAQVAQKLIGVLDTVVESDGHRLPLGACVGISLFPDHGADSETLLRNAATALDRGRAMGRNAYQVYTPDMHTRAAHRMKLEAALRQAIERDELRIVYQPQVDITDGRIVGMESLARWESPERGLVMPSEFIPLAEETGLIVPIGLKLLEHSCAEAKAWADRGLPPVRMSVNLSGRHFWGASLAESVAGALSRTGLDPRSLELEITEGTMMQNVAQTVRTLERLKAMDLRIAIDDFGTGHAALSYLKRFPVDTLKIDRSFVIDCHKDPDDAAITRAIIAMAHSLRLEVVAEGVEEAAQLDFLRDHACHVVQGYLFSKPVSPEAMAALLAGGGHMQVPAPTRPASARS
jgi:diguanylate cyclase (GGDEF)-like protein/PAS domain S-box-containing protein